MSNATRLKNFVRPTLALLIVAAVIGGLFASLRAYDAGQLDIGAAFMFNGLICVAAAVGLKGVIDG